ncbi:hypothetical protein AB0H00_24370 [Nocardia sp. NPDC023852]
MGVPQKRALDRGRRPSMRFTGAVEPLPQRLAGRPHPAAIVVIAAHSEA